MSMQWIKCGRILDAPWPSSRLVSHAAVPIAEHARDHRYRVYCSARDEHNRSHVVSALVDFADGPRVVERTAEPLLSPGRPGAFDDAGAMGSWLVSVNSRKYLYYIGWNLGTTVPFRNA